MAYVQTRMLVLAGVLTWLIVGLPHAGDPGLSWVVAWLAFIALFLVAARDQCRGTFELLLIALQSVLALVCAFLEPRGMQPVLLVIVAGQLGHLRVPAAMGWISVQTVALYLVTSEAEHAGFVTLGYFAFQLFGFLTARIAETEREARVALAEANAELQVATGLLDLSSRAEERLRIARDLHDLIGHHLTALSINLEVAAHLSTGQAREQIEKSGAIAKLLLSDVRDVVSRLREHEPVDLGAALRSLQQAVPSPVIHVDTEGVSITEPAVAQTALRAVQEIVTNTVRHANARNLWLKVSAAGSALSVDARDDGGGTDHVQYGNGLRGMRERVQHAGGTMEVASMRGRGFEVRVRIPLEAPA